MINFKIKPKAFVLFATAVILIVSSLMTTPMLVYAQNENLPHGGQGNGYIGPAQVPSGVTPSLLVDTNPYLSMSPNPTGIGQYILVNFWITPPPAAQRFLAGFTVAFTKPDGTQDIVGPFNSYIADGTCWFNYVVDQIGDWTFKFDFKGEYFPAGYYLNGVLMTNTSGTYYPSMYYKPASTNEQKFTVVSNQVFSWPPAQLPTDYWTRPIASQNREWYSIAGPYPWPFTNWNKDDYGPYVTTSNTVHIVWYEVQQIDGIIGGATGPISLTTAPATTYVTYAGRGYQTKYVPINGVPTQCAVSFDIRTGQQYYAIPIAQGGVTPYVVAYYPPGIGAQGAATVGSYELLGGQIRDQRERQIGSTLQKVNPLTGAVSNYTAMTGVFYNGQYVLSVQNIGNTSNPNYRLINWTTAGTSTNFATRIVSNISFPISDIGAWNDFDLGITVQTASFTEGAIYGGNLTCISLTTGQILWTKDLGIETMFNSNRVGSIDNGKLAICMENRHFLCWDLITGKQVWSSELTEYPWGDFWSYDSSSWNGLLIAGSYEGVYAFNWTNGKIVWNYKSPSIPYETPYNEYSWHSSSFIADGKFVSFTMEHTPSQPLTRGWKFYTLNATTGEKIWSLQGTNTDARFCSLAPGDGYLILTDQYSGTQWVLGKGTTATTVTAPDVIISKGTGVVIKGTVMDQSIAQPNTPCVSKNSMELQMEYLHMQMPKDGLWHNETITGVPVKLIAIGSDGNVIDIGTTTTNGYYGTFSQEWTPPTEGSYQVIATFEGDDSYGSSGAATALSVGAAPTSEPSATSTFTNASDITNPVMSLIAGGIIAIIIAIAIVGVIILRAVKRP
jgi:hypothetical protein